MALIRQRRFVVGSQILTFVVSLWYCLISYDISHFRDYISNWHLIMILIIDRVSNTRRLWYFLVIHTFLNMHVHVHYVQLFRCTFIFNVYEQGRRWLKRVRARTMVLELLNRRFKRGILFCPQPSQHPNTNRMTFGLRAESCPILRGLASSWDLGTYTIGDLPWLRRACAYAQTRQDLRRSHTQSKKVE